YHWVLQVFDEYAESAKQQTLFLETQSLRMVEDPTGWGRAVQLQSPTEQAHFGGNASSTLLGGASNGSNNNKVQLPAVQSVAALTTSTLL
ncbi:unnamed protein product, partial [Amoebophrya sp. A25]